MEISVYKMRDGAEKVFVDGREAQKDKDFETENISCSVFKTEEKDGTH